MSPLRIDLSASTNGLNPPSIFAGDGVPRSPDTMTDLDVDAAAAELDELYDLNSALNK